MNCHTNMATFSVMHNPSRTQCWVNEFYTGCRDVSRAAEPQLLGTKKVNFLQPPPPIPI